jgi:membrane protein implicated in regulation of membrane protease activity
MKKLLVLAFALLLSAFVLAAAQDATKQDQSMKGEQTSTAKTATKTTSVSGKVSDDGKTLTDNTGKSWTVSNPEALKGHEGHEVEVKGHVDAAKNEIHVTSVKMKKAKSSM